MACNCSKRNTFKEAIYLRELAAKKKEKLQAKKKKQEENGKDIQGSPDR